MKKRFLCAALALAVFASFVCAEGITLLNEQERPSKQPPRPQEMPIHNPTPYADNDSTSLDSMPPALIHSWYVAFNLMFPIQWQHFDADIHERDNDWIWGWGVGLDASLFFTQRIGLLMSADFYFPQDSISNSAGIKALDKGWSFSLFAGPSFVAAKNERILFAIAPGVHFATFNSAHNSYAISRTMFGLGASAELHINLPSNFFIRAGLEATYDFLGIEELRLYRSSSSSYNGFNALNIVPSIGIGIW